MESLVRLLNGEDLKAEVAQARHVNGAPGFYLALSRDYCEYFALRREGSIVAVDIGDEAIAALVQRGAKVQPIPMTPMSKPFESEELFIPVELFAAFNELRAEGKIRLFL